MGKTAFSGTIAFLKGYNTQPWPGLHTIVYTADVNGGNVRVWIGPDQRMTAVFKPCNKPSFYARSAPIDIVEEPWEMVVAIRWNIDNGDVWVNGQMAGSSDPTASVVQVAQVGRPPYWEKYRKMFPERSPHIQSYIDKRKHEVAQRRHRENQRPVYPEEYEGRLKDAANQIQDTSNFIKEGRRYFDTALADRIRALVCRFERGPSYPLLQHVAGTKEQSLLVYGMPFSGTNTECALAEGVQGWILGPLTLNKTHPLLVEMDLDEWLSQEQTNCNGIDYTNNKMLRAIADTCGTHYDTTVEPLVEFLQSISNSNENNNMMIHKLLEIGEVVASLSEVVLRSKKDSQ